MCDDPDQSRQCASRSLGDLTGDHRPPRQEAAYREAEAAYREALKERTRDRAAMDWAATQNNIGTVLKSLGNLTGRARGQGWKPGGGGLGFSRGAEGVHSRARTDGTGRGPRTISAPCLEFLGEQTGNSAKLEQAKSAFREALAAYDASGEQDHRKTSLVRWLGFSSPGWSLSRGRFCHEVRACVERCGADGGVAQCDGACPVGRARRRSLRPAEPVPAAAVGAGRACQFGCGVSWAGAAARQDALDFDAVRLQEINNPEIREQIEAARDRRLVLRVQLGFEQAGPDAPRREFTADERMRLQTELTKASEAYMALCRKHGLVRTPEPPTPAEIAAVVPAGGALVLPVLTEHEAFAFVVADGGGSPAVVELPRLVDERLSSICRARTIGCGAYETHFRVHRGKDPAAAARWRSQLTATTAWLWERLLAPVHACLRDAATLKRNAPVVLMPRPARPLAPTRRGARTRRAGVRRSLDGRLRSPARAPSPRAKAGRRSERVCPPICSPCSIPTAACRERAPKPTCSGNASIVPSRRRRSSWATRRRSRL